MIVQISFREKLTVKHGEGKPHAGFKVAGVGSGFEDSYESTCGGGLLESLYQEVPMNSGSEIFKNMKKAAGLKTEMFEKAKITPVLTSHALAVVLISSAAAGVGSIGRIGLAGIILGTFGALASWVVWVGFAYFAYLTISPKNKMQNISMLDFLRTSGFAATPGIIRIAGIISPLYTVIVILAYLWMIVVLAVALQQMTEYKTFTEAFVVSAGSWVAMYVLINFFLASRVF